MIRRAELTRPDQNESEPGDETITILLRLPQERDVRLQLFKEDGEFLATLLDERCGAGDHTILLDAAKLPDGSYFYRVTAGAFEIVRELVIARESIAATGGVSRGHVA